MQMQSNRGTGAGGANTNATGLPYEELTDLRTEYHVVTTDKHCETIRFLNRIGLEFKATKKNNFFKCMGNRADLTVKKAHGCKNPDECYISETAKIIFIIEKKFQRVSGSVCEKIQTVDFKLWQYRRTFPGYNVVYIYCLSDWFKTNCKAELEYFETKDIPVFWGNDTFYKKKIIDFILDRTLRRKLIFELESLTVYDNLKSH